jgi:hypothetical protein
MVRTLVPSSFKGSLVLGGGLGAIAGDDLFPELARAWGQPTMLLGLGVVGAVFAGLLYEIGMHLAGRS